MKSPRIAVLTYHGYNISGNDYHNNDHVALAEDLQWLHANGWQFVSLEQAVCALFDNTGAPLPERAVCLTFDDATDLDWTDTDFVPFGRQRSLHNILADFHAQHPDAPPPHATSFVIASPDARAIMADEALREGHGMSEDWWVEAESSALMSIGNHSWDHKHPLVVCAEAGASGFHSVNNNEDADMQVRRAGDYIRRRIGRTPPCFAYPWGQASDYLRHQYFPSLRGEHGCITAVSTLAEMAHPGSDRWYLPRFVCGHDWHNLHELQQLLKG